MTKTSFGFMQTCTHQNKKIEYLEFTKEGRFHQHKEVEFFTVLRGEGLLITDSSVTPIYEGETYSVPPMTMHKMKPGTSELKILVSYLLLR